MRRINLIASVNNPRDYYYTRHNVGAWWLNKFCLDNVLILKKHDRFFSYLAKIEVNGCTVYLLEPCSYMNNSGKYIFMFCNIFNISLADVLIIHDDLDLLPGVIKLKTKGGSAGHNGLNSVIFNFKSENFKRLRIGIGRPIDGDVINYVLNRPSESDIKFIYDAINASFFFIDDILNLSWNRVSSHIHGYSI